MARMLALLLILAGISCGADLKQVQEIYRAMLRAGDGPQPDIDGQDLDDSIQSFSEDEIKELLPLANDCLNSGKTRIQGEGISLLFLVSLRPDSTKLLEGQIDALGKLLKVPEEGLRKGAIYILGNTNPSPSPKALAYLFAHLGDPSASSEEIRMSAAGLLSPSHASDPTAISGVIDAVEKRNDPGLTAGVLEQLGLWRISTDKALRFLRSGMASGNPSVRRVAVESVGKMNKEIRARFTSDLQRLISDPNETSENKTLAERVLAQ